MLPPFLSLVALYETYLRRCFAKSGLSQQAIKIDEETKIQLWGPEPRRLVRKPALVFIHGFGPKALWQWRRQVQHFATRFDVYVPDLVFFGGSTTRSAERSEVFQAVSMGKLMEKLRLERFYVVGTSYGGFVAYHMARMWPERVVKVAITSSGINKRRKDNEEIAKRVKAESVADILLPETPANMRRLMELATFKRIPNIVPDFVLNDFIHRLYSENRKEKIELTEGLTFGKDDTPHVSPLQQEVLLVWGEHDQIFPLEMSGELLELLGEKAKLEVMKNTGHIPQIEDTERFNNILENFLCGGGSSS